MLQMDFARIGKKRYKFDKNVEESEAIEQLKTCIKRHIELISYVKDLEKIFSLQAILQYISSSLTICFIVFRASSVDSSFHFILTDLKIIKTLQILCFKTTNATSILMMSAYLISTLVQLIMFAKFGQMIINEVFISSYFLMYHFFPLIILFSAFKIGVCCLQLQLVHIWIKIQKIHSLSYSKNTNSFGNNCSKILLRVA